MARLLIENGGDIELRDSFGATAYDYAALREHVLLCFLLSASNTKLGRVSATAVLEAVVETERATLFAQYGKGDFPQFTSLSGTPTTLDNSLPSSEWFWVSAWRVVCEPETSTDGWRVRTCIFIFLLQLLYLCFFMLFYAKFYSISAHNACSIPRRKTHGGRTCSRSRAALHGRANAFGSACESCAPTALLPPPFSATRRRHGRWRLRTRRARWRCTARRSRRTCRPSKVRYFAFALPILTMNRSRARCETEGAGARRSICRDGARRGDGAPCKGGVAASTARGSAAARHERRPVEHARRGVEFQRARGD